MVAGSGPTYGESMDEPFESPAETEHAAASPPPPDQRSLRRSRTKKVFGGVAGGIAERFDVDANIVRVVFVVLALLWGLGIAAYLAMWVLIPRAPGTDVVEELSDTEEARRLHWLRFALPAALLVLVFVVVLSLHRLNAWSHGLSILWLVFLVVLAVAALFTPSRRLTLRRFIALAFLSLLSLLILLTSAFFLLVESTGVPLRGGVGDRVWHPANEAEVRRDYHGAIGESTVDLANVRFTSGTWHVTATEGVGQLVVMVPAGVNLDLITHAGLGAVNHGFYFVSSTTSPVVSVSSARLVLDLQVGVGKIEILRPSR